MLLVGEDLDAKVEIELRKLGQCLRRYLIAKIAVAKEINDYRH